MMDKLCALIETALEMIALVFFWTIKITIGTALVVATLRILGVIE